MRKVKGTVVEKRGKFFVQVGEQVHELNPNPLGDKVMLKANVGQVVEVVLTDPQVVAILTKKTPVACFAPCFICYYPIDIFRNWIISPEIREMNLKAFLEEGLISQEIYDLQINIR
jgi:hypothetical protein